MSKKIEDLTKLLQEHFEPAVISERYKFHDCFQAPHESIADFVANLRKLASNCEFVCAQCSKLDENLRDRFVIGINSETIRRRLLGEKATMTFEQGVQIAQSIDLASKEASSIQHSLEVASSSSVGVNKIAQPKFRPKRNFQPQNKTCSVCGEGGHVAENCKHKNATCHNCGKTGHISWNCRAPKQNRTNFLSPGKSNYRQGFSKKHSSHNNVNSVKVSQTPGISIYHVEPEPFEPKYTIPVHLNGTPVSFELDSGSPVSVLPKSMLPASMQLSSSKLKFKLASHHPLDIIGETVVNVLCLGSSVP